MLCGNIGDWCFSSALVDLGFLSCVCHCKSVFFCIRVVSLLGNLIVVRQTLGNLSEVMCGKMCLFVTVHLGLHQCLIAYSKGIIV